MDIELNRISVRDLVEGYEDNGENGVVAYGGRLNVRPPYQREFVYKDAQRNAVIDTVQKGFPLNIMYWVKTGEDSYEILDGQQRTVSICTYVNNDFSINYRMFDNLTDDEKEQILDYTLTVYICEGTSSEKLSWFKTVNIAGEELTDQELRNAVYTGTWLSDAKRYFSGSNPPAVELSDGYVKASSIRQEYLEKAIKWISNDEIEQYMSTHQHDRNANELWLYFSRVIDWVKVLFPTLRREMKSIEWGFYYNEYKDEQYDAEELEELVSTLMENEEVTSGSGVYKYVFDGNEKHLSLRKFPDKIKRNVYEQQEGKCAICEEEITFSNAHADHITAWHSGGRTIRENCQILCRDCNLEKSGD